MVTTGISTDRNEPRKSRMIRITMPTASAMVLNTSVIEALICSVASYISVSFMPSGRLDWISGNSASTAADMSRGLAPGVGKTPMKVPGSPLKFTIVSVDSAASSTRATSPKRTTLAPSARMGRAAKASGVCRVVSMVME